MKEMRVYVVDVRKIEGFVHSDRESFRVYAEEQGTVYTIEGFENAFNEGEIYSDFQLIKILYNDNI